MLQIKSIIVLFLLVIWFNRVNSQITIGNIEIKKDTTILKPATYDSLNDFKVQEKLLDYKQYIRLKLYLPPLTNPTIDEYIRFDGFFLFTKKPTLIPINENMKIYKYRYENILTCVYKPFHQDTNSDNAYVSSDAEMIGNKYYTIIDAIYGDELMYLKHEIDSVLETSDEKIYSDDRSSRAKFANCECILKLVNDSNGDTLYTVYTYKFFLVPYFLKQKQLYDKKTFIAKVDNELTDVTTDKEIEIKALSRWICEVNLLKVNETYGIYYILTNELNQKITSTPYLKKGNFDPYFILEDEYIANEKQKQFKNAELIAEKKKVQQIKIEKERIEKENHYNYCINNFGKLNGELIAQGKVSIGMTTKMCETSWGKPNDTSKTTTAYGTTETWYYGWKYSLHFQNGILVRIEN